MRRGNLSQSSVIYSSLMSKMWIYFLKNELFIKARLRLHSRNQISVKLCSWAINFNKTIWKWKHPELSSGAMNLLIHRPEYRTLILASSADLSRHSLYFDFSFGVARVCLQIYQTGIMGIIIITYWKKRFLPYLLILNELECINKLPLILNSGSE